MIVTKQFRFYAAHRNPEAGERCAAIHGHRYGLDVSVQHPRQGSVTILFSEIEKVVLDVIDPMDHALLLWSEDAARDALVNSVACGRVYEVPFQTSCENMAEHILGRLREAGLNVVTLTLKETDSSSVTVTA